MRRRSVKPRSVRSRRTTKQRGGSTLKERMDAQLEEAKRTAPPGMTAVLVKGHNTYSIRYESKSDKNLRAEANAASRAEAKASRSMMSKGDHKRIQALHEAVAKGDKAGASAKDRLKGQLAKKELEKL